MGVRSSSSVGSGTTLGRYIIDGKVAHGGMGIVWRARQLGAHGFERRVALKTIHPANANDPRYRQMMIDEARVASVILHPNVVQTLDVGDEDGVLFLVLEWVEGRSVASLHHEAKREERLLPIDRVIELLTQTLAGLHAAHEVRSASGDPLDVVHRDVSPDNILVTKEGIAKLSDFGIAKAKHRLAHHTGTGEVRGKLRYMAPEQALNGVVDRRADIYAAGAVLRELVSGTLPYDAESDLQQLYMFRNGLEPLPVPTHVPAPLRSIVERATKFDAEGRYATAEELRADLLAWRATDDWAAAAATTTAAAVVANTARPKDDSARVLFTEPLPSAPSRDDPSPIPTAPMPMLMPMLTPRPNKVRYRRRTMMIGAALASVVLTSILIGNHFRARADQAANALHVPDDSKVMNGALTSGSAVVVVVDVSAPPDEASAKANEHTSAPPEGRLAHAPARGRPSAPTHTAPSSSASASSHFNDYGF